MSTEKTISQAGSEPAIDGVAPWTPCVVGEIAEVISNDCVNAEYRHLVVRCGPISASAAPGQFFQLLCPHSEGAQPFLRRPMSLYGADPVRGEVEFLYKVAPAPARRSCNASRCR
jgi:dihydroorotate dehydrogenase electron transfer subunit